MKGLTQKHILSRSSHAFERQRQLCRNLPHSAVSESLLGVQPSAPPPTSGEASDMLVMSHLHDGSWERAATLGKAATFPSAALSHPLSSRLSSASSWTESAPGTAGWRLMRLIICVRASSASLQSPLGVCSPICRVSRSRSGNFTLLCDFMNIAVVKERVAYTKQRRQTRRREEQRGRNGKNFTTE